MGVPTPDVRTFPIDIFHTGMYEYDTSGPIID